MATATKKNVKQETKALREAGMKAQETRADLSSFEAQLEQATEALSTALTWKLKLGTHLVTLPDGKVRKYISVDSGMPRDVKVALVEGKDHHITVRAVGRDKLYSPEKTPLSETQTDYNTAMESWALTCGTEAKTRIKRVLSDVHGFDELWCMVELLERNEEIKASKVFF